jgi:hypothetical protein
VAEATEAEDLAGLVPGSIWAFSPQKKSDHQGDYHKVFRGDNYNTWFRDQLMANLHQPSLIMLDNAAYHCVHGEGVPKWHRLWKQEWICSSHLLLFSFLSSFLLFFFLLLCVVILDRCECIFFFVVASYDQQQQHNLVITSYQSYVYILLYIYTRLIKKVAGSYCLIKKVAGCVPAYISLNSLIFSKSTVTTITMVRIDTFEYIM